MKTVVVTGASGGLGMACVLALCAKGYRVIALDKKSADFPPGVLFLEINLADGDSVCRAVKEIEKSVDEIFAIVHFAGLYMLDSFVEIGDTELRKIFDVNLFGVIRLNKALLPLLRTDSRILITTSELAPLDPLPFTGIYAVTKAALDKYAYSLAMELQLLGIHVSVIRAGAVKTDMLGASTEALSRFCKKTGLYSCNAERFERIVNGVEARHITAECIAEKTVKILRKRKPKFAYSLNRNPLLLLLNMMPKQFQLWIIGEILKK